jgi:hypothetical protein
MRGLSTLTVHTSFAPRLASVWCWKERMKKLAFISMALLLIISRSTLGQDVRYNFDKDTDFSKFKTYEWVEIKGVSKPDDITDKQIKAAVDAQLAQKGLSKVTDKGDVYVAYQAAIGSEKQFTAYNSGWGYGPGWYGGGWYGGGGGITTGSTSTIYSGQLVIDMYNPEGHDLIWRGVASKTLDPKAKPEKREKNMNKALTKLFKNYPPKVKS